MFAALAENSEFFKPKMERFVAIAPVLKIVDSESPMIRQLANDDNAVAALRAIGPELMANAQQGSFLKNTLSKNAVTGFLSEKITTNFSDKDVTKIDKVALTNHLKFYPAGKSFQSYDHYK